MGRLENYAFNKKINKELRKTLIILGGNKETSILILRAEELGFKTITIDPNPYSIGKKYSSSSYTIDPFETEKIVEVFKNEKASGVIVGVADVLVKPYFEICKSLNIPCYVTQESIESFCSKEGFRIFCNKHRIEQVPNCSSDLSTENSSIHALEPFPDMQSRHLMTYSCLGVTSQ